MVIMSPLMNKESKSNRSWSDYFELLLTQYICSEYWLVFSYSEDMSEVMRKLLSLTNAKERIELQNNNFIKTKPKVKEIIDFEITQKGRIIQVIRTGRSLEIKTTSDVDAKHITERLTRFSVKSISWSGTWTLKNLWMRNFIEFYWVDYTEQYQEMWSNLKTYLIQKGFDIFSSSQTDIKKICNQDFSLSCWAENNCRPYQKSLNICCSNGFNEKTLQEKKAMLQYISDSADEDLYVIIANEKNIEPIIYKPIQKFWCIDADTIESKISSDTAFIIYVDNTPMYRVETNCTNWLWISTFCQRIFLINK